MNLPHPFELVTTEDGSPSLTWQWESGRMECMHSRVGAFTESVYIYGEGLKCAAQNTRHLRILSMGLGLGYNEILVAGLAATQDDLAVEMESFESEAFLRDELFQWVTQGQEASRLSPIYDQILAMTAAHYQTSPEKIQSVLRNWLTTQKWTLREALTPETKLHLEFNVVFYDAFSSQSQPELWSPDLLEHVLAATAKSCLLSTYAVTGNLKRTLKAHGFTVHPRPGFAGKRESTFATRMFPLHFSIPAHQ